MYYVYKFLDRSQNVIYVGKSKQELERRYKHHLHLPDECYRMVYKIEFIECKTESDMSIKEIYYINKYKSDKHPFFNLLDKTEIPTSVEFNDKWKMYRGALPSTFSNSINYKKGYNSKKETKYNKDGTVNQVKNHKPEGISSYVEALTNEEIDVIVNYLIEQINLANNEHQEQIRFRNLMMFVLAINLPIKSKDFLVLKYKDLFDSEDNIKDFMLDLGRYQKHQTLNIPLRSNVKKILVAYMSKYGFSYHINSEDFLFLSREHQIITPQSWGRIICSAIEGVNIQKNIGTESLRKTYGLNIYTNSCNQLNALLFLGEIWGDVRESKIIKYLGLTNDEIDYDYYLGESFAIGEVDLSKINCLKKTMSISDEDCDYFFEYNKFSINDKTYYYIIKDIDNNKQNGVDMAYATMIVFDDSNLPSKYLCIFDESARIKNALPNDAKRWFEDCMKKKIHKE